MGSAARGEDQRGCKDQLHFAFVVAVVSSRFSICEKK